MSTVGDGRLGHPDGAPYDAIHVGAAAATVPKAVRTHTALMLCKWNKKKTREFMHLLYSSYTVVT